MNRFTPRIAVTLAFSIVAGSIPAPARSASIEEERFYFSEIPSVGSVGFFRMSKAKAPGAILTIPGPDLDLAPARTLAEILQQRVPSAVVQGQEYGGPSLTVRGVRSRVNYMRNGQLMNTRMFSGVNPMLKVPLLGDIQSLEIVQGPGAIVHGSGAISGFVNMVPRNGSDSPGLQSSVEYGVRDQLYKGEAGYGRSDGAGGDFYLYGGIVQAKGLHPKEDYDYFSSDPSLAFNIPASRHSGTFSRGFPKGSYKVSSNLRRGGLEVDLLHQVTRTTADSYAETWFINRGTINHYIASLRPRYTLNMTEQDSLQVTAAGALHDNFIAPQDVTDPSGKNPGNFPRIGGSESDLQGDLLFKSTRLDKHSFAVGALYGQRAFLDGRFYMTAGNAPADTPYESVNGKWDEMAYYAEDVYQPTQALTFSLGGRYDKVVYNNIEARAHSFSGGDVRGRVLKPGNQDHFSPRAAMAVEVAPKQVVKLSYQQGFRTADANAYLAWSQFDQRVRLLEAAGEPALQGTDGLPELKPEVMDSFELNVHNELDGGRLAFDTSLFYNTHKDMLVWHTYFDGDGYLPAGGVDAVMNSTLIGPSSPGWMGSFVNTRGDISVAGAEFTATLSPSASSRASVSYAFNRPVGVNATEARDGWLPLDANGQPVTRGKWRDDPVHSVKLNVAKTFSGRFTVAASGTYFTSTYGLNTQYDDWGPGQDGVWGVPPDEWIVERNEYGKPRFLADLALTYDFTQALSLKLVGNNLTGNAVPAPGSRPDRPWGGNIGADDRYVYGQVRYKI